MDTKIQVFIALGITLIAVLYQIDCDPSRWKVVKSGKVGSQPSNLARYIRNPNNADKWFRWVSEFNEADDRPLGVGKKYELSYDIPIYGKYKMKFTLADYKEDEKFTLESDDLFKPRFTINLKEFEDNITQLIMTLEFRRNSALYQCTIGPVMWYLSDQQIKASFFILRMIFPF